MLYGARNRLGRNKIIFFWHLQGAAEVSAAARKTGKRRGREIRRANQLKLPFIRI